ncbi:MAG: hypothetical protein ACRDJO_13465 [Actinomycetota bacterium]
MDEVKDDDVSNLDGSADPPDTTIDVVGTAVRIESHLGRLADTLERIATVMERFDNAMNPSWENAAASLSPIVRLAGDEFPANPFEHGGD